MNWWQITLIVLSSVAAGLLVGGLVSYLIGRLLKKPLAEKQETGTAAEAQMVATTPDTVQRPQSETSVVASLSLTSDLVAEIESNYQIATEPSANELLPFQTNVWDSNRDGFHTLPANLREDLTQAYVNIHQANNIVWFSTELGHRSQNLDEKYMNLRHNIAQQFDRIIHFLKESDK